MSILLFVIAVILYSLKELAAHGKLSKNATGFWGVDSWKRKYDWNGDYVLVPNDGHKNFYERLFNIKYKERFFLSSTLLVSLTDGMHFCQLWFKLFLCASIAFYTPMFKDWYWNAITFFATFGVVFSLAYRLLSRQDRQEAK